MSISTRCTDRWGHKQVCKHYASMYPHTASWRSMGSWFRKWLRKVPFDIANLINMAVVLNNQG